VSIISREKWEMEEYIIKKYLNRKLYDTKEKKYVNLSEISRLIREGIDLKVIDNHSKKDITPLVLAQIIVEQEKTKKIMLPSLLSPLNLLGKGGESMLFLTKKMLLAGIGILSLTREKAEKIAEDLIKRGEINNSESKEFVMELLDKAEKEKNKLIEKIKPDIEKEIEKINYSLRDSVVNLEKKIDDLSNKIEQISKKNKNEIKNK
jgi:polyhydroxyalkanoate synthesis repressor PhaR